MEVTLDRFPVTFANTAPLVLIAGPCVLEDEASAVAIAERLRDAAAALALGFVFKASYDKANRTSLESFRGPGLARGLAMLGKVRARAGVPVLTDVHSPDEARAAGEVVDVVQVPAFLCRQTDLLLAAGATRRPVLLKKGQFVAPEDMEHAAAKVRAGGGRPLLCERGTSFGYRDLVVDMRALATMARFAPVVFDATHALQKPGAQGGTTGGDRAFAAPLARAAVAVGIAGLFFEVHPDPARARSDASTSLPLDDIPALLAEVVAIDRAVKRGESA